MIAFQCVHVPQKFAICVHMFRLKTMELTRFVMEFHRIWIYEYIIWPEEVHRINIAMAALFGPEVWEQIRQFLSSGSVREEILINMIE